MTTSPNNTSSADRIRVSDLNVVGFLVTLGREIRAVEGGPDRRVFVFDASVQADVDSYHLNAPVPARAFAASLRDLKGLLKGAGR